MSIDKHCLKAVVGIPMSSPKGLSLPGGLLPLNLSSVNYKKLYEMGKRWTRGSISHGRHWVHVQSCSAVATRGIPLWCAPNASHRGVYCWHLRCNELAMVGRSRRLCGQRGSAFACLLACLAKSIVFCSCYLEQLITKSGGVVEAWRKGGRGGREVRTAKGEQETGNETMKPRKDNLPPKLCTGERPQGGSAGQISKGLTR